MTLAKDHQGKQIDANNSISLSSSSSPSSISFLKSSLSSPYNNFNISPLLTTTINQGDPPSIENFNIAKGYKIEPLLWNLTLSSSMAFDNKGNLYVAESGYGPGGLESTPRILKIDTTGKVSSFVDRDLYGPITDLAYNDGKLYVSNRAKISVIDIQSHDVKDIITGLPSLGDFSNNQIAFGPDGRMYFGQGSVTNSGIIGKDNYEWLKLIPILHGVPTFQDVPANNITLTGQNFKSSNILTPDNSTDNSTTGAFSPFGISTKNDQFIKGDTKCSGCILSAKPDGTDLKVIGWGFRNPYGLAFDSKNHSSLIVTNQAAEDRGSRPISNDSDKIYSINISNTSGTEQVYGGWPDFFGNAEPVTASKFQIANGPHLQFLMKDHPKVQKPLSLLNGSTGIAQIAFSNSSDFGFKNAAFITESGDLQNDVGQMTNTSQDDNNTRTKSNPVSNNTNINATSIRNAENESMLIGQKIIVFNPDSKNYTNFISLKKPDSSFRPLGLKFSNDGRALYMISFGKEEIRNTLPQNGSPLDKPTPWVYRNTGILWRITNTTTETSTPLQNIPSKLNLSPELKVTINSGVPPTTMKDFLNVAPGYKMEPILWNLDLPGSFAFDNEGNMYLASTGITYGKVTTTPAIYKIYKNGTVSLLADRPLHGILSDIEFNKNNGLLYVAQRNTISTVNVTTGIVKDVLVGLPVSDYVTHPLGQLAIGSDGRIYISVGGLSNTAVPDISDWDIGWLRDMPFMHEVPGQNITLTGQNFMSENLLTADPKDKVITGGMMPFGTTAIEGQKIKGETRCTSCILSIKPDGSDLKLHAWGIRNAYGMVFDKNGQLFMISNGDDDKGIRRVTNDPDSIFMLNPNEKNITFFGWPDFPGISGESINSSKFNESPEQKYPNKPLIKDPPPVTIPLHQLGMSVGNTQAAYSTNNTFGYKGKIFVGEFGTIAPVTHTSHTLREQDIGKVMGKIIGQKVVVFDPQNNTLSDFISLNNAVASFRPVGLQFTPDGSILYLTSIEKEVIRQINPAGGILPSPSDYPFLQTGTVWKIAKMSNSTNSNEQINEVNKNNNHSLSEIPYGGNNSTDILKDKTIYNGTGY